MNDPIAEPAHAVTPAVPTPVVPPGPAPVIAAAKPALREYTVSDVVDLLNTLLRFQAVVVPVRRGHEDASAHRGPNERVRRDRREKPPEEWLVQIFAGGSLRVPVGRDSETFAKEVTSAMQVVCQRRQQEAATKAIEILSIATESPEMALLYGKKVEALVQLGASFARFGVIVYGNEKYGAMLAPRQAEVRYTSLAEAKAFAAELNAVISGFAADQIATTKALLITGLKSKLT
jgi:hypothetical protein